MVDYWRLQDWPLDGAALLILDPGLGCGGLSPALSMYNCNIVLEIDMTLGCVGHWSVAHLRDCWSIWDAWAPVRLIRPQPSSSHCFPIAALHFAQSKTQLLWEVYTRILWATAPELIVHDFFAHHRRDTLLPGVSHNQDDILPMILIICLWSHWGSFWSTIQVSDHSFLNPLFLSLCLGLVILIPLQRYVSSEVPGTDS